MKLPYKPHTVAQIPSEFQLLQDSQDIRACLESIGQLDRLEDVGCLFVSIGEGEYDAVYCTPGYVPRLDARVYQLA